MKKNIFRWGSRSVNQKFGLIFSLLLALVLLIGITSYASFLYISKMGEKISQSNNIVQLVLDMDRGMERARRLHSDFFIHYQRIGLQKAHERYAQPSVREIAQVVTMSNKLKRLLFDENNTSLDDIERAEVNLYLASAKRFAETSIEAVELISRRSAPIRGLESQLAGASLNTQKLLQNHPQLLSTFLEAKSLYQDYLVHRKRHQMQGALNLLHEIEMTVERNTALPSESKDAIPKNITEMEGLISDLLETDLAISAKLNDFSIQAWAIAPISKSLARQTREGSIKAEQQIKKAYLITNYIIVCSIVLAIIAVLYIARLVNTNITRNVLALTKAATAFSDGNLDVRVARKSDDELGLLASSFNDMAARLADLIDNLEAKVALRTRELSLSEERFRKLVNELPQIAVQGLNENLEIIYWNQTSSSLFGFTEQEAMGSRYEELLFQEQRRTDIRKTLRDCLSQGVEPAAAEMVLINKKGKEKHVYSAYAVQTSSLGETTMYCVHLDLTELKLAEVKSQISESFYRQLFDHSSSGVAVYEANEDGTDFIFKDFNKAGENIEQISREEVIGRSLSEVFPGMKKFGLVDALRQVWETGQPADFPERFYHDQRIQGWRENKIYKLPTGEVVTVYNDITRRKQAEEERGAMELRLQRAQKMEAIGLMAGGIAHDLNNILSAIIGYPELLLMQLSPESELHKPLKAIKEAGERAAAVVEDLLTVARGVASARSNADMNVLIREYLDSPEFYQLKDLYPYVRFETRLADTLPMIECSPVHVKKCLMNLATNGAEAIESTGAITFHTTTFEADSQWCKEQGLDGTHFVVLSVTDTGTGIETRNLERIFEPFYTRKVMGKRSGTGLGLSVVWNTMKEHGGAVLVNSGESGTSFHLYFPATEEKSTVLEEKGSTDAIHGNAEHILIVDDEPQLCNLAKSMLEHFGYTTACVSSGEEAITYLKNNDVDLVLLDMLMDPGINGRETYKQIKKTKPDQRAIIVSGFSESEDVKATLEMGAGAFIKKPYSMNDLARLVQRELSKEKFPVQ